MKKTETLLWLMRAHEAVRKLPDDMEINSVEIRLYGDGNRINMFLQNDPQIKDVVSRNVCKYAGCESGRVEISDSNGADYWWGVDFDADGNVIPRA